MKLYGVTMDFDDIKTCGLLPKLCVDWDHRSEELSENEAFDLYWNTNTKELLSKTKKVVLGNDGNKSLVYSADKEAITFIKEIFKEMTLNSLEYEEINQCELCITHDYLK